MSLGLAKTPKCMKSPTSTNPQKKTKIGAHAGGCTPGCGAAHPRHATGGLHPHMIARGTRPMTVGRSVSR